jgi:hypothetical protein
MRLPSALFAIFAAYILLVHLVCWVMGAPLQLTLSKAAVVVFLLAVSGLLWRGNRWAVVVGLVTAIAFFLLDAGAAYFLWPYITQTFRSPRASFNPYVIFVVPGLITGSISVLLTRELLSNQRLERPVTPESDAP